MVTYSQSTAMSRGGFAPNVQYNASVRMPTQPIPDLKQPDSKFNIDLTGLGRGLAQAAYQERLAQKEEMKLAKEQHEQMLKANFAREANLIQMGVDQGAYTAEAGQIKSRALSDRYLSYGMDPDELFPIYENAVSTDVRDVFANRRKNIETAKNEVESAIVKDVWSKVPETTNWSYEEALNYGRRNQMIADEMELAMMNGVGEEEAANKFIDVQAGSTVLNMQQGLMDGTLAGPEAKLQTYRSTSMALAKKNPNMSASMVKDLTTRRLTGVNSYIDMMTTAKEAERKLISDRFDTYVKEGKLEAFQYLDPEDRAKALFGLLDPMNMEDARVFGPKATQIGTQEVTSADGRTTTPQPTFLVQDLSGNNMVVTAASSEEAIEILNNASKRVYPEGSGATPYIKQALPQAYNNVNVSVKDFQTMSPEDAITLAENREAVDAVAGSVNNRNTLKNDTASQNYIDNQFNITAGIEAYNKVPGVKEVVNAIDADVRSLVGNEVMLANTRINKEGYLVAATDVQGGLGTLQQYLTGAKYRDNLDKVNRGLSGVSVMHRPSVAKLMLASYGKDIKNYDPNVDGEMSSIATPGERAAQNVYETVGEGWRLADKGIRKFDEKVFIPLQNTFQEGIEKYVAPYLDEVEKALPTVIADLQGGEGTYKDYLMNNIKESTNKVAEYISTSIANYRALQAGKDAPGLAGIVNKPDAGQALQEFLDLFKIPSKIDEELSELESIQSISKIETTDKEPNEELKPLTPKEEKTFFKYLEEETDKLVDNYIDEMSEIVSPLIDSIDTIKTGFSAGQAITTGGNTNSIYDEWATMLNRIGKKPAGLIRQALASAPYTLGVMGGGAWEGVKILFGLALSEGFELDTESQQKLERLAKQVQREVYKRDPSLWERFMKDGSKYKFFSKYRNDVVNSGPHYYGNKKVDELNQALIEPFLYD